MSKVTFAFTSGKCLTCNTEADSIVDFFELNERDDGRMTGWLLFKNGWLLFKNGWLLFKDGHAVKVDKVDWILVEEGE